MCEEMSVEVLIIVSNRPKQQLSRNSTTKDGLCQWFMRRLVKVGR